MARDYQPDYRGFGALLRSEDLTDCCVRVAQDLVPRVAAFTPRGTGDTAASTRAEPDRGPDGRAAAKIVQDGAGVQTHFGNARSKAQSHLHRALGNG